MNKIYNFRFAAPLLLLLSLSFSAVAQTSIEWQKTIGTTNYDDARKIINDKDGNFIVLGNESHVDITGQLRNYMLTAKFDVDGNEIWKKYHDVNFETHNVAFDFYMGDHFYTEESGQKVINIVMDFNNNLVLYKLFDATGELFSYENLTTTSLTIDNDNVKIIATTGCAVQLSCYGPDSLTIQKINPIPDSNWITTVWEHGMKQDLRTTPIQGHYDFDVNDITTDENGNVYVLVQIERWDFLFCTDCNDQFVDSWNMLYKLNPQGELLDFERLNITTAVVSHTQFLSVGEDNILIRIDDINNAGTAVKTSIYRTDENLVILDQFDLDRFYNHVKTDEASNIYAVTNVYDQNDPNIKGESDVYVTKFNSAGDVQWKSYYGGSSFDFPKGFVLTQDDGIAFLVNTQSTDFDVDETFGFQDMWLVKLSESTTSVDDGDDFTFSVYPNPTADVVYFSTPLELRDVRILDISGKELMKFNADANFASLSALDAGSYLLEVKTTDQQTKVFKVVKM